ncbi:MAG: hypothetical protein AMJ38_00215 [Dehalococcoidia bacterium DG_22]|nr:MAG: hypothetical protein AMJ38_00215 [Dehalococcoidia bacterium DG_22]
MSATLKPTDPQPGEPGTSFAGFVLYREMPPANRSLREVGRRLGRSESLIERYSSRWNWVERVRAWDKDQSRRSSQAQAKAAVDWVDRHAEEGRKLQIFAMAALSKYIDRDPEGRIIGVRNIPLRDALVMMKLGSQIERAAAGAEPLGAIDSEFVMAVADAFAAAFQEVNTIEDHEERAAAFQERCLAAASRLLAGGDGNGG